MKLVKRDVHMQTRNWLWGSITEDTDMFLREDIRVSVWEYMEFRMNHDGSYWSLAGIYSL